MRQSDQTSAFLYKSETRGSWYSGSPPSPELAAGACEKLWGESNGHRVGNFFPPIRIPRCALQTDPDSSKISEYESKSIDVSGKAEVVQKGLSSLFSHGPSSQEPQLEEKKEYFLQIHA